MASSACADALTVPMLPTNPRRIQHIKPRVDISGNGTLDDIRSSSGSYRPERQISHRRQCSPPQQVWPCIPRCARLFTQRKTACTWAMLCQPVFEALERRHAVVYVHPNPSPDADAHSLGLPDNLLDFPTDTNRAVAEMHYTNRFARTTNVK